MKLLRDHDFLIRLDPEFAHYETLPLDPSAPSTRHYKITDHMKALPKGLWDSTVSFDAEMTDIDDGLEWVIKAPMGLDQKTYWRLRKTQTLSTEEVAGVAQREKGEWSLVEDVNLSANKLLVSFVRNKCEENWKGIHTKFVKRLQGGGQTAAPDGAVTS